MKRLVIVLLVFLLLTPSLYAQEDVQEETSTTSQTTQDIQDMPVRRGVIENTQKRRIQNVREQNLQNRQERRAAIKTKREELQEQFKNRVEELRKKREEMRENFKQKREDFREKIKEIRDQRKKQILERIDRRINEINRRHTEHWNRVLERLTNILGNLQERADRAKADGVDTSSTDSLFQAAKTAINSAQSAVSTQSGKDYIADITDETKLKGTVSEAYQSLTSDLKTTRQTAVAARKAVKDVAVALRKLKIKVRLENSQEEENNGSTSATIE